MRFSVKNGQLLRHRITVLCTEGVKNLPTMHLLNCQSHYMNVYYGNTIYHLIASQSIWLGSKCLVCCQLTFGLGCGCGHCFGIRSTVELCRFCVSSLHREVGGVRQYTQ